MQIQQEIDEINAWNIQALDSTRNIADHDRNAYWFETWRVS